MSRWTAVVLAGSRPAGDPLAQSMMVTHKALVPVGGEPMVLRPVRTLLDHPAIAQVIAMTQDPADLRDVLPDDPRLRVSASKSTIAATLSGLVASSDAQFPVLVTTADHALLDRDMLSEFIAAAAGVDLALGVVERAGLMARFPGAKRTWVGFKGGSYSGANLFAFGSRKVLPALEQWRSVEQERKKGWRMLAAFGPALLMGAVLKLRTVQQSASAIARRFGLTVRIVEMSDPLAAVDVDKVEDHALVEAIIAGRA